jgi:hypothetical protein
VPRRAIALAVLALAVGAGPVAQAAKAPLTAESLLAAGVPWTTVRQVAGPGWWPGVPQFESPPLFRRPLPKRPLTVASQWYVLPGADTAIQTTLLAFAGTAEPGVCPLLAEPDGVPVDTQVPAVGVNHVFWVPGEASAPLTIFCFERGPVAVEIKVLGANWRAGRLGRLALPVDASLKALLAGKLAAPVIAAAALAQLPGSAAAPGRVLGTAAIPAEAWASNADDPTPQQLLGRLKRGGAMLLARRYLLADATNVIDVTVFSFASDAAATGWFDTLSAASETAATDLPTAGMGTHALFRQLDEYDVLDFVAGHVVADATCYAPYGEQPPGACTAALNRLGGRWYAQLSRG